MEDADIESGPRRGDADHRQIAEPPTRREWVRANFTAIFGISAEELLARGINPRQYAGAHRDEIRRFARAQRARGIAVPGARPTATGGGDDEASSMTPTGRGPGAGRRLGAGVGSGTAWIGVLVTLLALRFVLVDAFVGPHAAIVWVLWIGGIVLVARVLLFSWLRERRRNRRRSDGPPGRGYGL